MAREPMTVEVVRCGYCAAPWSENPPCCDLPRPSSLERHSTATLAPGSRSEKVQRLGEAHYAYEEGSAKHSELVMSIDPEGGDEQMARLDASFGRQKQLRRAWQSALAALRQHDTEHGRTTE